MYTLGINAAFHDSAACLIKDGELVAAGEEERFTRIKHAKRPIPFSAYELPFHAIDYCLAEAGLDDICAVDHIAYSFDPYILLGHHKHASSLRLPLEPSAQPSHNDWQSVWDPLFLSYIVNAKRFLVGGVPHHLERRFRHLQSADQLNWHFVPHHLAHAASAFLVSPFTKAAVVTLDGRGERATTTYALGQGATITLLGQVNMPHSLGLLYERVTRFLGFLHASDEYKVMALASYGKPSYLAAFHELIAIQDKGQYLIRNLPLESYFGPARQPGEPLEKRHFDLASSLQIALEQSVLQLLGWLAGEVDSTCLTLAGGVALNCVMNSRIRDEGPFESVWVQPAAGDAGTALGAAAWVDTQERCERATGSVMQQAFLGPQFDDSSIESVLRSANIRFHRSNDITSEAADALAAGKIIGWFQGRMEFGPRALGARSILASPCDETMQSRLNAIKEREDFRPVAPVVLAEEAKYWFSEATASPFMLFVSKVQPDKAHLIPAVCHVDGTARIQTITSSNHPLYYELVKAFAARTGVPVLVNTSFNICGEPIVCSPQDAIKSFFLCCLTLSLLDLLLL